MLNENPQTEKPRFLKKSHWPISLLSSIVSIFNIIFPMAMARVLPLNQLGTYRIFFFYLQAIPAFSLSLGFINGLSFWGGRGREGHSQIQSAGGLLILLSLVLSIVLFLLRFPLAKILGLNENVTIIFILATIPTLLQIFYETAEIATGHIWRGAIFSAVSEMFRIFSMFAVLLKFRTLESVLIAHCVLSWAKVLIGMVIAWKRNLIHVWPEFHRVPRLLSYAAPVSWASLFDQFVTYPDKYILTSLISKSEFAVYSVGCLAIPPLSIFEQAVNKVLIPEMSYHLAEKDSIRCVKAYREAMIELMLFLIPSSLGLIVFAEPIIEILFTAKFIDSAEILRIYALSYLIMGVPHDVGFRSQGKSYWILKTQIIFSVLSLLAVFFATYAGGIKGTLWATLLAQLLLKIYGLFSFQRDISFHWKDLIPLREWSVFFVVAGALSIISILIQELFNSKTTWFIGCGALFILFYFILIHFFGNGALVRSWKTLMSNKQNRHL